MITKELKLYVTRLNSGCTLLEDQKLTAISDTSKEMPQLVMAKIAKLLELDSMYYQKEDAIEVFVTVNKIKKHG